MNLSKHKRWRALLHRVIAKQQKKNRLILCVYIQWKSMQSWRMLIHRMITKQQVKNELIKRKQTYYLCNVNVFKFRESKFKIIQNNI